MTRPREDLPVYYLKPGEMILSEEPTLVSTLLGSCISVVMFNRRHHIGAICHSLLPVNREPTHDCKETCVDGFRYVECSIRRMVGFFLNRNISRGDIEVKMFGGSDMFSANPKAGRNATVGNQNIEMALKTIEEERLRLVISDVGGQRGRKIFFYTHTGEVLLKRLNDKDFMD